MSQNFRGKRFTTAKSGETLQWAMSWALKGKRDYIVKQPKREKKGQKYGNKGAELGLWSLNIY